MIIRFDTVRYGSVDDNEAVVVVEYADIAEEERLVDFAVLPVVLGVDNLLVVALVSFLFFAVVVIVVVVVVVVAVVVEGVIEFFRLVDLLVRDEEDDREHLE